MKKWKLIALLLAAAIALTFVAGCSNDSEQPETTPPAVSDNDEPKGSDEDTPQDVDDEGIVFPLAETFEFSFWVGLYESYLKSMTSLDDHPIHQELEKLTNVHVDFIHPTYGSESEAFSVMLNSEIYPDVFATQYHTKGNADLFYTEIIIELSDFMPKYMPNYYSIVSSDKDVLRDVKLDTGELVAIHTIYETIPLPWRGLVVRQDLLDEIGVGIPETANEWESVLTAFRDMGVEKPLFICNNGATDNTFEGLFNIGQRLYRDGDTVKYGPYEPGYRQYVEFMRDWFNKGLIDKDFMGTAGFAGMLGLPDAEVINSGKVGASNAQSHTLGSQLADAGVAASPDMYFSGTFPPVNNKGDAPNFSKVAGSGRPAASYALSIDCAGEKVPTILKYFDFLFGDETRLLRNYGIQGVSWEYDENGVPQYTDLINASSYDGVNTFHVYDYSLFSMPYHMIDRELIQGRPQYILDMQQKWVVTGTDLAVLPNLTLTDEESAVASAIINDLNTYADEMTVKFITGVESLDKYDDFIKTMETMNIEKALEAYQAAYDRYLAR
jgi:putative aldouronate transport system substrate-binding protein